MAAELPTPLFRPGNFRKDLIQKSKWIRDELEPDVAFHGDSILSADTVLQVHIFLLNLTKLPVNVDDLRVSRVHLAVEQIRGKATRWPGRLINICDQVSRVWTLAFGQLNRIRPLLYEEGGRLHSICEPEDISRRALVEKWENDPSIVVCPENAHEFGNLSFTPGDWWIHPVFAYRAGIIDNVLRDGWITADGDGAYAITLGSYDELEGRSADVFTYRPKPDDFSKHRLTEAILCPSSVVRVLRSNSLHSPYAPVVGIRYDGLYKVTGWKFHLVDDQMTLDFRMQREPDQKSIEGILRHPKAEEVDDFHEYRRLRNLHIEMSGQKEEDLASPIPAPKPRPQRIKIPPRSPNRFSKSGIDSQATLTGGPTSQQFPSPSPFTQQKRPALSLSSDLYGSMTSGLVPLMKSHVLTPTPGRLDQRLWQSETNLIYYGRRRSALKSSASDEALEATEKDPPSLYVGEKHGEDYFSLPKS